MHAAAAKAINAVVQPAINAVVPPMLQKVTKGCALSPKPQNKGLMSGLDEDVTSRHPQLASLTPTQVQALDLVLRGHSLQAVADQLEVSRKAVSCWRNHHPAFIAELNRRQDEVLSQSTIRFRRLLHRSINVLDRELTDDTENSVRIALSLVNGTTGRKALDRELGPTDPVAVVNDMVVRDQSQWEHPDAIVDEQTHLEYANRLSQLDFTPERDPDAAPESADDGVPAGQG